MTIHVLLVEDDAICALVEKGLFENFDCKATVASSGEDALKLIRDSFFHKQLYDAIAMDIGLPEKSGIETCVEIRKFEAENQIPFIPIVAVTSNMDADILHRCLVAGMIDVMTKPLTPEKISEFLSKCHH